MSTEREKIEKKAAIERAEAVSQLKHQVVDQGIPPSKAQIVKFINLAEVELDNAKSSAKFEGLKLIEHAQDLLDAIKAIVKEHEGVAGKFADFVREASSAIQDASQQLHQMKTPRLPVQEVQAMQRSLAEQTRTFAERTMSVLRTLSTSWEGRQFVRDMARLVSRLLQLVGETVEEVAAKVEETAAAATEQQPTSTAASTATAISTETKRVPGVKPTTPASPSSEVRQLRQKGMDAAAETRAKIAQEVLFPGSLPSGSPLVSSPTATATGTLTGPGTGRPSVPITAKHLQESAEDIMKRKQEQAKREMDARLDRISSDLRMILRSAARRPEMNQAIRDMSELLKVYLRRLSEIASQVTQQVVREAEETAKLTHAQRAVDLAQEIVRMLVPHDVLDRLNATLKQISDLVEKDERLKNLFDNAWTLLNEALNVPEVLDTDEYNQRVRALVDQARDTFNQVGGRFQELMQHLRKDLDRLMNALKQDEHLKDAQKAVQGLYCTLFTKDSAGKMQANTVAFHQLRQILGPMVFERLKLLALPPIHYSDDTYELCLDECVISTAELPPSRIDVHLESDFAIDTKEMQMTRKEGKLTINMRNLQIQIKDCKFNIQRKKFPRQSDAGHFDMVTPRGGIHIKITYVLHDMAPFIGHASVECHMDGLEIKVKDDAEHQILLQMITGAYKHNIEQVLCKSIVDSITKGANYISSYANTVMEGIEQIGKIPASILK